MVIYSLKNYKFIELVVQKLLYCSGPSSKPLTEYPSGRFHRLRSLKRLYASLSGAPKQAFGRGLAWDIGNLYVTNVALGMR